jgi:hypothetical protein
LLALGMPLAMFLGRASFTAGRIAAWPAFLWMGFMFLLLVTVSAADIVRVVAWLARRRATWVRSIPSAARPWRASPPRRWRRPRPASRAVAVRAARGPVAVKPSMSRSQRLPAAHDGLRLVQITDVHVGTTIGRAFVEDIVRRANALSPDIVAITGDLVDGSVEDLREAVAPSPTCALATASSS